jgi:hypothetical protein
MQSSDQKVEQDQVKLALTDWLSYLEEKTQPRLLLLEIKGVMCSRRHVSETISDNFESLRIYQNRFILRPQAREFLRHCLAYYTVGIFSSLTDRLLVKILKKLTTADEYKSLAFVAGRNHTKFDPSHRGHLVIKRLEDVLDNPVYNFKRKFSSNNTLICDSSLAEVKFNDSKNVVLVQAFDVANENDEHLLTLPDILRSRFNQLTQD